MKYSDGSTYEGQWNNDEKHGQGKFVNEYGDIYEGEFFEGMFEGFGKYTYKEDN